MHELIYTYGLSAVKVNINLFNISHMYELTHTSVIRLVNRGYTIHLLSGTKGVQNVPQNCTDKMYRHMYTMITWLIYGLSAVKVNRNLFYISHMYELIHTSVIRLVKRGYTIHLLPGTKRVQNVPT